MLKNVLLDCFVNFSTTEPIMIDRPIFCLDFVEPYPSPEIREIDTKSQRFEAHLTQYNLTTYQILLYSSDEEKFPKKEFLKGGDLIRLQHTESEGYLMADKPFESEYAELFIGNY